MKRMINDRLVPLTPEEQAEREAARAEWDAGALDRAKDEKLSQINSSREEKQSGGVEHAGHIWQTDKESRALLTGAIAGFQAGVPMPDGFFWTTADNQDITMTMPDLINLAGAIINHVNTLHGQARAKKVAIEALTTTEQVEAFDTSL